MDLYRIGILLSMSSNHNAVLAALSSQLFHVHTRVNQLTGSFGRLKIAISGALGVAAASGIVGVMVSLVEQTKEYSDELTKLKNLGGAMAPAVASGEIARRAFDISQRVPMKVEDLMKIPGASYSILGQEDSMRVWEKLAGFTFLMQSQKDFKGDAGEDLQKFLRAGELGGRLTDPSTHKAAIEELEHFLDLSQRIMAATHNMVTPSTLLGLTQQAGFSMRGMTDQGFMNMAIFAQAMGGQRAGTAMLSLYNQVATGKMTQAAARGMVDLGLLKDSEWETVRGGGVRVADEAKARLGKILGSNPMDFIDQIYKNLEAKGITDPGEQQRLVAQAISRQTSERFTIEGMMNRQQIAAERERMAQGASAGTALGNVMNESVGANIEGLKNAFHNLLDAIAGPQSETAIAVMKDITGVLNSMQTAALALGKDNIKVIAEGLGLLAGALAGGGILMILSSIARFFGPAGMIVSLLIAAVPALWRAKHELEGVIDAIIGEFDRLARDLWGKLKNFFQGNGTPGGVKPGEGPSANFGLPGMSLMMFKPGNTTLKTQPISLSLNVDGRTLAQTISDQLEYLYEHATGAPSYDGMRRHISPDGGLMGT